jgi:hypothetical protein
MMKPRAIRERDWKHYAVVTGFRANPICRLEAWAQV